ncbi:MAG: phosphatase PAP2 family protein [Bacilli bacterium]|nr:phosphatase PAP2 family protein [Bacilli bacterium]
MKKKWILCGILITLFLIILISVLMGRELFIDNAIINFIRSFRNPTEGNIKLIKTITLLGDKYFVAALVVVIATILYFLNQKKDGYMMVLNLVNIAILNKGIKYIVRRPRPLDMLIEKDGFSFPSGHSMLSIGVYGFIIFLIWKSNLNKKYKILYTILISLLILIVGYTRLYLGVHYPSDVIGGYLLTSAYLIIFISYINKKVYNKS